MGIKPPPNRKDTTLADVLDPHWNHVDFGAEAIVDFSPQDQDELELWKAFALAAANEHSTFKEGPGGFAARMVIRYRRLKGRMAAGSAYRGQK
jgi:hypothetical protein